MKTSQSLNTITHSNTTTTTTTNLDSSDWPSLNSELQNADLSLNLTTSSMHHHHNQVTQIPLSKSCNFDAAKQGGADQDDSNSNNNSKKLQQQQQQQKQIKWKPLIVEPPKRERKSYRNARPRNGETTSHGGSTSTRRSHRTRSLDRQKNNMENNKSEQGLRDEAAGDADGEFDEEYENTSRNRSTLVKSKSTTHRGLSDSVGLNI